MFHIRCILCTFCTLEHLQIFYKYINIRNLISTGDNGIKYHIKEADFKDNKRHFTSLNRRF